MNSEILWTNLNRNGLVTNYKKKKAICSICGKRFMAYEKVRHCRECHSKYNLVLSRQKGESIIIGEGGNLVEMEIVDIRRNLIRLGIKKENYRKHYKKGVKDVGIK